MKKINLYFDFEFTSLSPDAQPVSLGIVSDSFETLVPDGEVREYANGDLKLKQHSKTADGRAVPDDFKLKDYHVSKSFYSEFSDFDMNRCDDWVKENVVSKLRGKSQCDNEEMFSCIHGDTKTIIFELSEWLSLFSDYEITFVGDCLTWDWYHLLQLIGEWEYFSIDVSKRLDDAYKKGRESYEKERDKIIYEFRGKTESVANAFSQMSYYGIVRYGLPKLPENISPVPLDLNDLIAFKKGISVKEAFELDRETLANKAKSESNKHNALWDAKITKYIYNNLK